MSDQENTVDTATAEAQEAEAVAVEASAAVAADAEVVADAAPAEATAAEEEPGRFTLPSQADIRLAAEIHEQCQAALETSGNVQIDCGLVERVDAAVLQCIGSLAGSLRQGARELELIDRTESFDHAVSVLGFEEVLVGRSADQGDQG